MKGVEGEKGVRKYLRFVEIISQLSSLIHRDAAAGRRHVHQSQDLPPPFVTPKSRSEGVTSHETVRVVTSFSQ